MGNNRSKAKKFVRQTLADFSATEEGKKFENYFDKVPDTDQEKVKLVDNYALEFTVQAMAFRSIGCRLYPDEFTRLMHDDRKEYARTQLGLGFEPV